MLGFPVFLSFVFSVCLIWTNQLCSGVEKDIEKIEILTASLKNLDPVKFDSKEASNLMRALHLDLTERPADVSHLYTEVAYESSGGCALIFKAKLAQARPKAGLKAGDIIAIRAVHSIFKPLKDCRFSSIGCEFLVRLSTFKKLEKDRLPITDYFPDFYGVYFSGAMPRSITNGRYPDNMEKNAEYSNYRYEEMEWVDTTFAKFFDAGNSFPDSIIFEFLYGEWAGNFFLGISIDDPKYRNYGLKTVNYSRCYHLGESTYYFSSNLMPIRLDLDTANVCELPQKQRFFKGAFSDLESVETENGKNFLVEWYKRKEDMFTLFERFFSEHKKDNAWVNENASDVKHFFLEQKWIEDEKILPL